MCEVRKIGICQCYVTTGMPLVCLYVGLARGSLPYGKWDPNSAMQFSGPQSLHQRTTACRHRHSCHFQTLGDRLKWRTGLRALSHVHLPVVDSSADQGPSLLTTCLASDNHMCVTCRSEATKTSTAAQLGNHPHSKSPPLSLRCSSRRHPGEMSRNRNQNHQFQWVNLRSINFRSSPSRLVTVSLSEGKVSAPNGF